MRSREDIRDIQDRQGKEKAPAACTLEQVAVWMFLPGGLIYHAQADSWYFRVCNSI